MKTSDTASKRNYKFYFILSHTIYIQTCTYSKVVCCLFVEGNASGDLEIEIFPAERRNNTSLDISHLYFK